MERSRISSLLVAISIMLTAGLIITAIVGCAGETKTTTETEKKGPPTNLILATTTSTADTGLLDYLLPMFEKKFNVKVKPIAVGSGEAIAMGQRGEADVLLVHSRADEDKFMADGNGSLRYDVMYNDFVVLGPKGDPAKTKGKLAAPAFTAIAAAKSPFVTRGDNSGTHKKELKIWTKAGVTPTGQSWYIVTGQGMGESLRVADEKQAYILADRGTYLATKKSLSLVLLVEDDPDLFNPYGVIVVSKTKFPNTNEADAKKFADWLVTVGAQQKIEAFGKDKYGQSLFYAGTPSTTNK
ncbi:MAG: substrate-binding domain-containing protein [Actinomycetota bacterium]